jgi:spore maturation protein CgeB
LITDKVPVAEKTMQGCMIFTDGGNDLTEKIKYYLEHEKERELIAQRGYEYAISYASLDSRMKELLAYIDKIL